MTDFGSRHKASHQDGGGDEIDATGLVGRVNYVDRGDPAVADWTLATLTVGGAYQDLDCSSIVPEGVLAVHFSIYLHATAAGKYFTVREKGNSNARNNLDQRTQAANLGIMSDGIVSCDANRTVQYASSGIGWTVIEVLIRGWLI